MTSEHGSRSGQFAACVSCGPGGPALGDYLALTGVCPPRQGIKRKTLDILQQLGLSNSVMRIIEQRTRQDKIFFWAGAAVTTAIMTLSYYYLA